MSIYVLLYLWLTNFDVTFSFSFSSMFCFLLFWDFPFEHGLSKGMLFCFQVFGNFCFLSVTDFQFNYIVIGEHTLNDFNILNLRFGLWPRIWSTLVYDLWQFEQHVYAAVWGGEGLFCKRQLDLVWLVVVLSCSISLLIFYLFYQLLREGCWRLYNCGFFYFSFQFYWGLSLLANKSENPSTLHALLWYHPEVLGYLTTASSSPDLLRYNRKKCNICKVYNMMIWYTHTLWKESHHWVNSHIH